MGDDPTLDAAKSENNFDMTMYQNARSVRLPMYFPAKELPLHGKAAMCTWYLIGPKVIMPKRRPTGEILVEEVLFVAPDGVEHSYGHRDLVRDAGMPLVENPQPWL
jgi:hypothetical protein